MSRLEGLGTGVYHSGVPVLEESAHAPFQRYGRNPGRQQKGQCIDLAGFEQGFEAPQCRLRLPGSGLRLGDDHRSEGAVFHRLLERRGRERSTVRCAEYVAERRGATAQVRSGVLDVDAHAPEDLSGAFTREPRPITVPVKAAREERVRAYAAAYKGSTSTVDAVMAKLIEADRKRCRRRLE